MGGGGVPGEEVFGVFPVPLRRPQPVRRPFVPCTPPCLSPPASSPGDLLDTHRPRPQRDVTPSFLSLSSSWEPGDTGLSPGWHLQIPQARGRRLLDAALPSMGPGTSSSGLVASRPAESSF